MQFEKWQALGNDYVIVERDALPWPLTTARVALLCDRHRGVGADGVLELSRPAEGSRSVAALRIFNPDGSEAELSGNGAREAILYLRAHGWTSLDSFAVDTAAGEIRPQILSARECRVAMGRALVGERGEAGGAPFVHLRIGNPQTVFAVGSVEELEALDLSVLGPPVEHDPRFPGRTNVSWYAGAPPSGGQAAERRLRARIFERGVGETQSSGTGACGAAIAFCLSGAGPGNVTVVLDGGELVVGVDADLNVELTGWAEPVYAGAVAGELLAALAAL
jgi:diaminopimelate epimerase